MKKITYCIVAVLFTNLYASEELCKKEAYMVADVASRLGIVEKNDILDDAWKNSQHPNSMKLKFRRIDSDGKASYLCVQYHEQQDSRNENLFHKRFTLRNGNCIGQTCQYGTSIPANIPSYGQSGLNGIEVLPGGKKHSAGGCYARSWKK
jgi:hypothetical protein